ncbi:hypothetical protein TNIN_369321 [Trichonephila inaurata madagascariensis]|uniref:Uncharacterized protein n=1 Tax=Trichonephila inaurata madagascariensis TaxID=2747483 RepID=A0A8X6XZW4_9ARAC|nr:hypothetical protein TNIN_369321 [Trichonephila inaurata madagascariensis]
MQLVGLKLSLSELLFDLFRSTLMALESLGRTKEKFAEFLGHWLNPACGNRASCVGKGISPWKISHRKMVRSRCINYCVFFRQGAKLGDD